MDIKVFKHQYNFEFNKAIHTKIQVNKKSETIPEMSYSIRELLDKYTTGGLPPIQHDASYDEDVQHGEAIEMDTDLTDIIEARNKVFELKKTYKNEQAQLLAKKRKKVEKVNETIKTVEETKTTDSENNSVEETSVQL